ncbi:MAG: hypothetical protein KKA60_05805 [Proteobacteria bacterium]|nr:hypothetical protein [Pseudomonadota bacterium]
MILLITNKDDVTTDFIANRLNKIKANYYRLNTEDLISSVGIIIDIENNDYFLIDHKRKSSVNLSAIKSVYYRRPGIPQLTIDSLSDGEIEFINTETLYLLEGIYKILIDRFWISPIASIREAENKIYQLLIARDIGFEIPKSLITTSQEKIESFFSGLQGNCITKPIKSGRINDPEKPKVIFTSLITKNDIRLMESVCYCPMYLQNEIGKIADIRVTVVGNKVFTAKILSQEFQETMIDWRKGENSKVRHERMELPSKIEHMCVELIRRLNLQFGAIDLVLDQDSRYIFLEINPNGQWGWIEKRLGYNISGEIVNLLLTGGHKDGIL